MKKPRTPSLSKLKGLFLPAALTCWVISSGGPAAWAAPAQDAAPPAQKTATPAPTPTPARCAGPDRRCASGAACNAQGYCIACGGSDQGCCPKRPQCGAGLFCSGASCLPCGQKAGDPCCPAGAPQGACADKLICSEVTATCLSKAPACGTQGAPCCSGGPPCARGLACGAVVLGTCDAEPESGL